MDREQILAEPRLPQSFSALDKRNLLTELAPSSKFNSREILTNASSNEIVLYQLGKYLRQIKSFRGKKRPLRFNTSYKIRS
ncbi:MAG: hypothetical protein QNJ55_24865 [Xenococcus sp. MO_188.B8]|nr:hypothetical protein [Xenococcus sp. MO_188.B8]